MAPKNSDGEKTPPDPPDPSVRKVAASFNTNRMSNRKTSSIPSKGISPRIKSMIVA